MILYSELKYELIFTWCNFISLLIYTMTPLEKLCADIIYGKLFKDKPEIWEQILRECWYNVEKIKEDQRRVAYFKASAEYEDYLNSIWLSSYDLRRDEQASTYEDEKEFFREQGIDIEESDEIDSDLPF